MGIDHFIVTSYQRTQSIFFDQQNQIKIQIIYHSFLNKKPSQMNHSKHKEQKHSKRAKTQPSTYSPFDESIVLLTLSKIHKCLHDIAKSKFDSLPHSITHINKEMDAISSQSKQKQKMSLLIAHLNIFQLISQKKYPETLQVIKQRSSHFNEKTHKILKLSIQLLEALTLKHLQKQEDSKNVIQKAIRQLELIQIKVKPKTSQQKIIESAILCISITADYFAKFQTQSFDFRQIYTEAYKISHKYLTQYHKLTQTLFAICKKFPQENVQLIRKSKKKRFKTVKKRKSLNLNSNRYFLKDSSSERSYLNQTIQPKSFSTINDSSDFSPNIRGTQVPKNLRTIDPGINLRQEKQICLSKLYGTDLRQVKEKTLFDKKYFKRAKISYSLKPLRYEPNDAIQMKQLEKISELYLPKVQPKKKDNQFKKKQKLNAVQIIKFSQTLSKLKPSYFDRIRTEQGDRISQSNVKHPALLIDFKDTKSIKKNQKNDQNSTCIQKQLILVTNPLESLKVQKELKDKLLIPLNQQQEQNVHQKPQQNCQLI